MSSLSVAARAPSPGYALRSASVQGLAFALERPVLPVSTLATIAQRAWREHGATQVAAAIDARMDEVYWGCYREHAGEMQLCGSEAVLPPEQAGLPRDAAGSWFGAGTGWGYAARIPVTVGHMDAQLLPHAEDLLRLATFAWQRGEAVEADHGAAGLPARQRGDAQSWRLMAARPARV